MVARGAAGHWIPWVYTGIYRPAEMRVEVDDICRRALVMGRPSSVSADW